MLRKNSEMLKDYLQVWIVKIIESRPSGFISNDFQILNLISICENLRRFVDMFLQMRHPLVIQSLMPSPSHDIDQNVESFDHFSEPDWMVCETHIVV
jgi:hypothetical protein